MNSMEVVGIKSSDLQLPGAGTSHGVNFHSSFAVSVLVT